GIYQTDSHALAVTLEDPRLQLRITIRSGHIHMPTAQIFAVKKAFRFGHGHNRRQYKNGSYTHIRPIAHPQIAAKRIPCVEQGDCIAEP
ncbi:MAG: hypothetical protein ACK5TA_06395, partial [bacterium]